MHTAKLIILSLLFSGSVVNAVTCQVPSTAYPDIQAGVDDLSCDVVDIAAGFYSNPVMVSRDMTLQGVGYDNATSYTAVRGAITINADAILNLSNLAVEFITGSAVVLDSKFAEVRGDNIRISSNSAYGVDFTPVASDSIVNISNCIIDRNNGGIRSRQLIMNQCSIQENTPNGGAEVGLRASIDNSTFISNERYGDGGGILLDHSAGILSTVNNSFFFFNHAISTVPTNNLSDGGGIMVRNGRVDISNTEFKFNSAGRFGGAISSNSQFGSITTISNSLIHENTAYGSGGAIAAIKHTDISNSIIRNNRVVYDSAININGLARGGGIFVQDNMQLLDSTIEGNQASNITNPGILGSGGGLYLKTSANSSGSLVNIERSTFNNNSAEVDGGGLYVSSPNMAVGNSSFSRNTALRNGGGIYSESAFSRFPIKNSTIAYNTVQSGNGGGIYGDTDLTLAAVGSNIDLSTSPDYQPDCSGLVVSDGFSAIGIVNGCSATWNGGPGNQNGTTSIPLDLGLLALADNGGFTQTLALAVGSPLLDAGTLVCAGKNMDQRGSTRLQQDGNNDGGFDNDTCDIGAFETYKSGCEIAPITLTQYIYTDTQDIRSKSALSTIGNVRIADTADVQFVSSASILLQAGFSVASQGRFVANIMDVSCP